MKKIMLLLTLITTLGHAAEIRNRDVIDSDYIKIMNTGEDQYSFAHCTQICSWIGEKNSYSKLEIEALIDRLKRRTTIYYVSEGTVLAAATTGAILLSIGLGWEALVELPHYSTPLAILAGAGALVVAFGVPTAGLTTVSKVDVLNPNYPKRLAEALDSVLAGEEVAHIKVSNIEYIASLLEKTIDKQI